MAITDRGDIKAIVSSEIERAIGERSTCVESDREVALAYYRGENGGENGQSVSAQGRSSVVSTDVSDTVEALLPGLIEIFTASDSAVEFKPQSKDDEQMAREQTEYINHIFYKDNDGFMLLYDMFKDALIQKTGVSKVAWEEEEKLVREKYEGLTPADLELLLQNNPNFDVLEQTIYEQETQDGVLPFVDVTVGETRTQGKVKIYSIAPEDFLINPEAQSLDEARFCAQQCYKTRSELVEQGFPRDLVDSLPAYSTQADDERSERFSKENTTSDYGGATVDRSQETVEVTECYLYLDLNDDGIAELHKVTVGGSTGSMTILDVEEVDIVPFAAITPLPEPHKFFGRSIADLVIEIQQVKTFVMRQTLDNMTATNNQKALYNTQVDMDLDAFINGGPAALIGTDDINNSVLPLPVPPLPAHTFGLFEYLDSVREARTGVTRYNQGMDADSLNKTATGINRLFEASNERKNLIARVFAETGVKRIFKLILEQVCKHQDYVRTVQVNDKYVPMDPRQWTTETDMSINVGLGTGSKDQRLGHVTNLLNVFQNLVQMPGGDQFVSPMNVYNLLSELVINSGFKEPDLYLTPPQQGGQPQQEQPNPDQIKAEAEVIKAQTEKEVAQIEAEVQMQELRVKQQELALREQEMQMKAVEMNMQMQQQQTQTAIAAQAMGMQ